MGNRYSTFAPERRTTAHQRAAHRRLLHVLVHLDGVRVVVAADEEQAVVGVLQRVSYTPILRCSGDSSAMKTNEGLSANWLVSVTAS